MTDGRYTGDREKRSLVWFTPEVRREACGWDLEEWQQGEIPAYMAGGKRGVIYAIFQRLKQNEM